MYRQECSECHGNCEPGEMVNGVCLECLEKKRLTMVTKSRMVQSSEVLWEQGSDCFAGKRRSGYGIQNRVCTGKML